MGLLGLIHSCFDSSYIDVDECKNSSVCAPGKCVNTEGSFKCACLQGYTNLVDTPGCEGNMKE